MPPESWDLDSKTGRLHVPDRSTDLWALGLILHLLSFFVLPYHKSRDDDLEQEIRSYPGFFIVDAHSLDHGTRHDLPQEVLRLMSRLVHRLPASRPSCVEVLAIVRQLRKEMDKVRSLSLTSRFLKQGSLPQRLTRLHSSRLPLHRSDSRPFDRRSRRRSSYGGQRHRSPYSFGDDQMRSTCIGYSSRFSRWERYVLILLHRARTDQIRKAISIQRFCGSGGLTGLAVYAVLLPTLTDTAFGSWWATLSLGSLHLFLLLFQGGRLCVV